jgi:hypothetical protein
MFTRQKYQSKAFSCPTLHLEVSLQNNKKSQCRMQLTEVYFPGHTISQNPTYKKGSEIFASKKEVVMYHLNRFRNTINRNTIADCS